MAAELFQPDPWAHLRRHTDARIALGRSGGSLPTGERLRFDEAQALARDAVRAPFEAEALAAELRTLPAEVWVLASAAPDRAAYLLRPDLGRRLDEASRARLTAPAPSAPASSPHPPRLPSPLPSPVGPAAAAPAYPFACDLVVMVSDGLSALAAHRQAAPLLRALWPRLQGLGFRLAPLLVIRHARVGLIDEVGALLAAELAVILLGERPGLGAPDSLGAYFGYGPGPGRTDADRNCVSNIRPAGLPPAAAAEKLAGLLEAARRGRLSGTGLKDPGPPALAPSVTALPPAETGPARS
jgi:ethanolamine ammonia-lyase small subunit